MPLFKISNTLTLIKEKPFKLEKDLQSLTEDNLKAIFGYDIVKSEFSINKFRYIDSFYICGLSAFLSSFQ